jgi:hypothetical protein
VRRFPQILLRAFIYFSLLSFVCLGFSRTISEIEHLRANAAVTVHEHEHGHSHSHADPTQDGEEEDSSESSEHSHSLGHLPGAQLSFANSNFLTYSPYLQYFLGPDLHRPTEPKGPNLDTPFRPPIA